MRTRGATRETTNRVSGPVGRREHDLPGGDGRRLRIAFVITRADDLGGAQVHVRDLSGALLEAGHEVSVLAGREGVLAEELRARGVGFQPLKHLVRPIRPAADLRAFMEIRRRLREASPDILSTHSSKAGVLGRLVGRSLGIPTVFTAHGWAFAPGKPAHSRWLYRTVERLAAPLASRIVTVSEWDRRLALRHGVGSRDRIRTIHNAMPAIPDDLVADPGRSPPRLVMVARFAPQKDHAILLEALSELTDLEWRLDLVGEGALREEVATHVERSELAGRTSFLGFRRNVPEVLARSQAFVLTSHWEGLPRSILEAMRAGLPVVASDVGGVAEAVRDGSSGFLVARGDVADLRSRLRTLLADPALRRHMGDAGRRTWQSEFTFPRLVEETTAVYWEALREPVGRASGRALARPAERERPL